MANKYGEAALLTARAEAEYRSHPGDRWDEMVKRLYPTSPVAQRKSGPRHAFLGLCEEGLVKGIPAGHYGTSNKAAPEKTPDKGKGQALRAVALLQAGTPVSVNGLWAAVSEGTEIPHASQMDVVLALWKNGLIVQQPGVSPKSSPK